MADLAPFSIYAKRTKRKQKAGLRAASPKGMDKVAAQNLASIQRAVASGGQPQSDPAAKLGVIGETYAKRTPAKRLH